VPLQLHLWTFALRQVCNDATPMYCSNSEGKTASLLFSAALQNRLTARLFHCNCTYGHLLFIQVWSDATPMHCSNSDGKTASLLFSAALRNRLTAALCHCNRTFGHLLFIQVWSDATPMHCSTGQGKIASLLFSAALRNRLTAALCHCNCTYGHLLFIRCAMMQHQCIAAIVRAKQLPCCSVLLCKTGSQQPCATAIAPMDICSS